MSSQTREATPPRDDPEAQSVETRADAVQGGSRGDDSWDPDALRFAQAAILGALASAILFVAILWNFGLTPLRTGVPYGWFGDLYEVQAHALVHGHLSVPNGSLGLEGFIRGGHTYLYFGPLPALLRIPVMAITHRFDGRMTAPSILVAWILFVTFASLLAWRIRRMLGGAQHLSRREAGLLGLFVFSVGASVVLYLAGTPQVYEEALAWSTALAIGAFFAILGIVEKPTRGRIVAAGVLSTGAILSRSTAGWACCATLIAVGCLAAYRKRTGKDDAGNGWVIALAGLIPLAIGAAINWAKFRTPFTIPYSSQVWTTMSAHRRVALARNSGGLFSPKLFFTNLIAYFRPDGLRFVKVFPFVTFPAKSPAAYGGYLDRAYRTGSVTDLMPFLFVLACWGVIVTIRRGAGPTLSRFRIPILGAAAITGGIMLNAYIAGRYVVEFVPVLAIAGVVGLVDLFRRSAAWRTSVRRVAAIGVGAMVAFGAFANTATSAVEARTTFGGQSVRSLISLQERVSDVTGHGLRGYVEQAPSLGSPIASDHLRVVGDCQAVYLSTGDWSAPWEAVDIEGINLTIRITGAGAAGSIKIARFAGPYNDGYVVLDRNAAGLYRLFISGGPPDWIDGSGDWTRIPTGTTVNVRVAPAGNYSFYAVSFATPLPLLFPITDQDNHGDYTYSWPYQLQDVVLSRQTLPGVDVTSLRDPASSLCRRLLKA